MAMTELEVAELVDEIEELYLGKLKKDETPEERFDRYYKYLKDADKELVFRNLKDHVLKDADEKWPPTIPELLKRRDKSTIPTIEETREYINRYPKKPLTPEQIEEVEKRRAAMRKRLTDEE